MGHLRDHGRHRLPASRFSRSRRVEAWLDDRLPPTLQGRIRLGARELLVVLAVAALAIAAAACVRLGSSSAPAGPPPPLRPSASVSALASARPSAATEIVVDIAGKVAQPGVYRLPQGSRVQDAIARAGGVLPDVDLLSLNQARLLVDGEQVAVGVEAVTAGSGASGSTAGGVVHLNSATQAQLEELPGVGPVMAQKILDWRKAHGSFSKVADLREVGGVGEKTFARLEPLVGL